jgi:hypothetical protein
MIEFAGVTFSYVNGKVLFRELSLQLTGGLFYLVRKRCFGAGERLLLHPGND